MTVRFMADEDLDADIIAALRDREPAIDILDVRSAGLRGTKDPVLLEIAAQQDRVVITHDRRTMTRHIQERRATGKSNPGLFIVPQRSAIGEIVEWFVVVWTASQAEECVTRSFTCPSGKILLRIRCLHAAFGKVTCPAGFAGIWQNGGLGTAQRLAENPRR